MLKAPQSESAEVEEMVNGYEAKAKTASVTKNSTDVPGAEASFPDLDEKPKKQDGGRLTYERDFLLQFQTHPMCMLKPEGLPDLEIVLRQARTPSRSRFSQNRMQPKDGGENMFLPAYLRQNSRNSSSNQRAGRRNVPPKKVIDLAPKIASTEQLKRTEKRWMRPSEAVKDGLSEEQMKTEEILRKVRSILNKLTPQKFQTLTQQIIDLEINTQERLEGAIDLIFEKAIDEAAFSVAYANMCRCLIPKKVLVEKDGTTKELTFRKILLNKCQKEFEKEKSVEKRIHEKLEELTSKGLSEEELEMKKNDLRDEETQVKRRTLGNIRFIGELFKLKMLTESIMHDCVVKLLKSNDEEAFECLCKLLVTIGKDLDHAKAKPRVDQYFAQINKIIQARITSARVRFMMQDIVDLRNNNWVPRREDNNPKTIDQIHKEAADAAKKTQLMIQMAKQDKKLRGNMGGRDSPRPSGGVPQADETWTTVSRGPKNVSVDPKRFQNIKRPVDSENISLGPGGKGFSSWARGSSGGTGAVGAGAGAGPSAASAAPPAASVEDNRPTGNRYSALAGERKYSAPSRQNSGGSGRQEPRSPMGGGRRAPFGAGEREKALEAVRAVTQPKRNTQEREGGRESPRLTPEAPSTPEPTSASVSPAPELTPEAMKKKAKAIIEEYLDIRDMKEAVECVKELQSPSTHHVFVTFAFNHTVEQKESSRKAIGRLFHFLLRDGVLTNEQYLTGVEPIMKSAEDLEVDVPLLWKYLAEMMGQSAFDGNLNLDKLLLECVLKYVSKQKAAKLFFHLLETAANDTSREDVSAILSRYNVRLNAFFDTDKEAIEFAKDKNIEFALGQVSSSQNVGSATQHSAKIQEELRNLILKRKARNEEVFEWIDEHVPETETKEAPFIRALVTAVCEDTMENEDGGQCKCNVNLMKVRKSLLQKYIDINTHLELQALFAVQALFVQLDHPPGFIKSYFDTLYDEEVVSEDSFNTWESSSEEQLGKGVAVAASSEFFRWLRSASEEPVEES
ncbi:eukaryotic translation initiation factor 4 gamma 3-like isoform X3 [Pocillopora damicornis]|nr:eukaryotic translation initiation factor 4 gamma 3-like isoform X3 [Pocillopora damicornis]